MGAVAGLGQKQPKAADWATQNASLGAHAIAMMASIIVTLGLAQPN